MYHNLFNALHILHIQKKLTQTHTHLANIGLYTRTINAYHINIIIRRLFQILIHFRFIIYKLLFYRILILALCFTLTAFDY